jgi:hypothetical protein
MLQIASVLVSVLLLAGLCVAEPVAEAIDVKVMTSLYQKYNAVVAKDWYASVKEIPHAAANCFHLAHDPLCI